MSVGSVTELYQSANLSYSQTLHRATPYLLGVSLGYLLHKTGKRVYIPKVSVTTHWNKNNVEGAGKIWLSYEYYTNVTSKYLHRTKSFLKADRLVCQLDSSNFMESDSSLTLSQNGNHPPLFSTDESVCKPRTLFS